MQAFFLGCMTRRGLFGSVVHGMDRDGSDLDLLVDLDPGISLFDYVGLQLDLRKRCSASTGNNWRRWAGVLSLRPLVRFAPNDPCRGVVAMAPVADSATNRSASCIRPRRSGCSSGSTLLLRYARAIFYPDGMMHHHACAPGVPLPVSTAGRDP